MFAFKKFVSRLLFPASLIFYPLLLGVLLIWFGKTRRKQLAGKFLVSLSLLLFVLFTMTPLPSAMLRSLEYRYEPFDYDKVKEERGAEWSPDFIVVLAGDFFPSENHPPTSNLGPRTTARVMEGVRVHRLFPESRLIFTGGKQHDGDPWSCAKQMAEVAKLAGVPIESIVLEEESKDTKDHVRYLEDELSGKRFVLVTSAAHMPRAMGLFQHAGHVPVPGPVTFYTKPEGGIELSVRMFIPSMDKLRKAEGAFYEYLGIWWAKLRGQI
ncbi:MAG: ElyC/SanA/YdcF family protein [Verrucomicrobiota bacterium]